MTTTINAVSGTGLVNTPDGSGVVKLQSNGVTTNALAWATVTGTTGAVLSSYNISSVTRNSTGNYTANFSTTLSDNNYSTFGSATVQYSGSTSAVQVVCFGDKANSFGIRSTTQINITCYASNLPGYTDPSQLSFAVFGN